MAQAGQSSNTPERVLLAAIFNALSPKKQARVLELIGETKAENVIPLRGIGTALERNELVTGARQIVGAH